MLAQINIQTYRHRHIGNETCIHRHIYYSNGDTPHKVSARPQDSFPFEPMGLQIRSSHERASMHLDRLRSDRQNDQVIRTRLLEGVLHAVRRGGLLRPEVPLGTLFAPQPPALDPSLRLAGESRQQSPHAPPVMRSCNHKHTNAIRRPPTFGVPGCASTASTRDRTGTLDARHAPNQELWAAVVTGSPMDRNPMFLP